VDREAAESASFRIPAALDAKGRLVVPAEARKGKGARYRCPGCEGEVDLHAGERKRRHFHHRAATCSSETVLHLSAKRLVAQAVEDWLAGGPSPVFVRRCAHEGCEETRRQSLPAKVARVALEHGLPSGHVADVALLARGIDLPVAVVEIVHSHAVDRAKGFEIGIPWIEVSAAQVCEDGGRVLVAVQDRFVPWLCPAHAETRGRARREERDERSLAATLARKLPFRLADFPGFRIEGVARCPAGHDALVFAWEGKEPPWPRPPLVVAVERDFDWSFGAARSPTRVMPWRRAYASACGVCGVPLVPHE